MRTSVLVIEHEPQTMQRLLRLFRAAGYAPLLASSARAALGLLTSERFDVVVTDDGNAAMSADELARHLRARGPASAPPVVRMTSCTDVLPGALFAAVVARPVDPLDLLHAVERALATRRRQSGFELTRGRV